MGVDAVTAEVPSYVTLASDAIRAWSAAEDAEDDDRLYCGTGHDLTVIQFVLAAIVVAGYRVLREGEVPPWMEKVTEVHERPATPEEVDEGCELGVAFDDLYRVHHRVRPLDADSEAQISNEMDFVERYGPDES